MKGGIRLEEYQKLEARHLYTIFRNEENGYTVAKFVTYDAKEEEFTATGIFKELIEEERYTLQGEYKEHARYGMQFQVVRYEKMLPNDESSLIRYFSSSAFPGIGKKTAKAIVSHLGEDALTKIKEDIHVLDTIEGMNEKKRNAIYQGIKEHGDLDDSIVFFSKFGMSVKNIMKLEAAYGKEAVEVVKENPYQMVEDIDGIGFATADKVAMELSFEMDHPYRIKAAILAAVLDICMANGDTYVVEAQILRELKKRYGMDQMELSPFLSDLYADCLLICEDERIYHHTQYEAEKGIAVFLGNFPYEEMEQKNLDHLDEDITRLEQDLHISYEDKQKQAIASFFKEPFSIITGGPGTGKTTIVQGILSLYQQYYPEQIISLCAPTGRAAKRLAQLSDGRAVTIHSLLKWDLESNTFLVNESDPIMADVLIVDEFSMVDQWLFYNLLQACRDVKKILLIGDEDQLASVGPGCVLKDLIESKCFPLTRLEKIFRQQEGSDVVTLAHMIREKEIPDFQQMQEIAFFPCQNFEVRNLVNQVVGNALKKGYDTKDIQVLVPMYQGVAGIDALNNALQQMMNPPDEYKRELKVGYRIFREEDKILQLKNQLDDQVSNGDIGILREIIYASEDIQNKNKLRVEFDDHIVEYSGDSLYNISHAYCISIHKSQGSEYPIVILPVVKDYRYMLQKRLLYTAITRAKKSLVLLGDQELFLHAIKVEDRHIRKSTLTQRILSIFG